MTFTKLQIRCSVGWLPADWRFARLQSRCKNVPQTMFQVFVKIYNRFSQTNLEWSEEGK